MKLTISSESKVLPGKTFELPDDFCAEKGITKRVVSIYTQSDLAYELHVEGRIVWVPKSMCRFIDTSNHTFDNFMERAYE